MTKIMHSISGRGPHAAVALLHARCCDMCMRVCQTGHLHFPDKFVLDVSYLESQTQHALVLILLLCCCSMLGEVYTGASGPLWLSLFSQDACKMLSTRILIVCCRVSLLPLMLHPIILRCQPVRLNTHKLQYQQKSPQNQNPPLLIDQ